MKHRALLIGVVWLALIAVVRPPELQAAPPSVGGCSVFPSDHVWNTPIDTLPLDANSLTYVNTIGAGVGLKADFGAGLWEGGPIGIPYVTVPGTQPKYPASFLYDDESDPGPYAVPLNAPIEGGANSDGDRHAISIDTTNCILYELYRAFPGTNAWTADSGAIYDLDGYDLRPAGWTSADAAGLAIFPGLVRYDEILAGEITHAIRFTVPKTRNTYIWPARHKASSLTGTQYPPMGQRFRLRADFDISTYSATNQIILKALKKYGMILSDNGSAWYMSGAPDERWNNSDLNKLKGVLGSNLEAIDESSLIISPNSGQAKQPGAPTVGVTVSPSTASVNTATTQQFTATVTGSTNTAVTWSVNDIVGGNATVGTISATGLYTAPAAVPNPSTITVRARSVASSTAVGSATVTVTATPVVPAPAITSVTPSSVQTGNFSLTIDGTGFVSGSVVKFGSTSLTTTYVSATRLTATGSTSTPSSGVAVTVTNPGNIVSNVVNVTVVAAPVTVTISPTSASLRTGQARQFTATVSNASNPAVTWKVNGIVGGNSTVGTISSSGYYRAPSRVPSGGSVTVSATSVQSPAVSASATVSLRR